jgi:uncharacterized protein
MRDRGFECCDCGQAWEETSCSEGAKHGYELTCPYCGSARKVRFAEDGRKIFCGSKHDEKECRLCMGHRTI